MSGNQDAALIIGVGGLVFFLAIYGFDILAIAQWNSIQNLDFSSTDRETKEKISKTPHIDSPPPISDPFLSYYQWRAQTAMTAGLFLGAVAWIAMEFYARYRTVRCLHFGRATYKIGGGVRIDVLSAVLAFLLIVPAGVTIGSVFFRNVAETMQPYSKEFKLYHVSMIVLKLVITIILILIGTKRAPDFFTNVPCLDKLMHGASKTNGASR
tara:strand:+ start:1666 stop:2298 length:633 start_codon:yes stop_codon:yes gene_type:complete